MICHNEDIISRIIKIFRRIKDISGIYDEKNWDMPLTGTFFNFTDRDMVYLLLELISEFDISFRADDVEDYRFNSIRKIINIVLEKVELQT